MGVKLMSHFKHVLWGFGNRLLRAIFGSKREEVTGEWRKLHNLNSDFNIRMVS
jgi:hypothetical protein